MPGATIVCAEPNLPGALTGRGQENFGRRRMRVLLEKVVLHFPHVVDAEPVREFDLIESILEELQLRALLPWTRQLMLIKGSQLHKPDFLLAVFIDSISQCEPHESTRSMDRWPRWTIKR